MRLTCLLATALAVALTGAADACCFLKCLGKSRAPARPRPYTDLMITEVGGYPVNNGEVKDVDPGPEIVVIAIGPAPCDDGMKLYIPGSGLDPIPGQHSYSYDDCEYKFKIPAGKLAYNSTYKISVSNGDAAGTSSQVTIYTKPQ